MPEPNSFQKSIRWSLILVIVVFACSFLVPGGFLHGGAGMGDAAIDPPEASYDLGNPAPVTTTIVWNDASVVESVYCNATELAAGIDYEVTAEDAETATLNIFKAFFKDLSPPVIPGDELLFEVHFETGTIAHFRVSVVNTEPRLFVNPVYNIISGLGWPENTELEIEVLSAAESVYTGSEKVNTAGNFELDLEETLDLQHGHVVKVTGSDLAREHVVTELEVTTVSAGADTVSGTAYKESEVLVIAFARNDDHDRVVRSVYADSTTGVWLADFHGSYDITPGSGGIALQWDHDWNATVWPWHLAGKIMLDHVPAAFEESEEEARAGTGTEIELAIETENMLAEKICLERSGVWLDGREGTHNYYQAEVLSIAEDGAAPAVIARFAGVQPGVYELRVKICYDDHDIWEHKYPLHVMSYEDKPVFLHAWNWAVPEGTHHIWLGFDGYRLHDLINDDGYIAAQLVNLETEQVEAETGQHLHFHYDEHHDNWINMEFEVADSEGPGIPAGEYMLVIESENWDEELGLRIEPLYVLAEPFIGDWVNPRELGAGQSAYTVKVEGKNLHKLDDDAVIAFELGAEDGPFFERVLVAADDLKYDRWGYGSLAATFSEKLPQEHLWLQFKVGYWDAAENELELLPGGDRFELQLADWPVLYDFGADKYYPDDSYHLHFKGWNLPLDKEYRLRLYAHEEKLFEKEGLIAAEQNINVELDLAEKLMPGHYWIELESLHDHDHFHGHFDWHIDSAYKRAGVEEAVADGLAWLAAQQHADGSWGNQHQVAKTALAVLTLASHAVNNAAFDSPFDADYPYHTNIEQGLNFLFAHARLQSISTQYYEGRAVNPDTNANGLGLYFNSPGAERTVIYETAIAAMALAGTMAPERTVELADSPVQGWTYGDVLQDTIDYLAWAQTTGDYGRGGWDYQPMDNRGGRSDQSITGWVTLALAYAEAPEMEFEAVIPGFVRTELERWVDYIQVDEPDHPHHGGADYCGTGPEPEANALRTGNLLQQMAFLGDTAAADRVQEAVAFLVRHWDHDWLGWQGHPASYQATFTIMKGLEALDLHEKINSINWFADFNENIRSEQDYTGFWPQSQWDDGEMLLSTAWALLTLQRETAPTLYKPDLIIDELKVDWANKDEGSYRVGFKVKNRGNEPSDAFHVALYLDGGTTPVEEVSFNGLSHTTVSEWVYFADLTLDSHMAEIMVCADSRDEVAELNEDNNCRTALWPPSISGRVVSADGETPLPGASVDLGCEQTGEYMDSVQTDADGYYVFHGLPSGDYRLQAGAFGYLQQSYEPGSVNVRSPAESTGIDFVLEPGLTRAEMCELFAEKLDLLPYEPEEAYFHDVPLEHEAAASIYAMFAAGLVSGYAEGYFGPDQLTTREQFVAIIFGAFDLAGFEPHFPSYHDVQQHHWSYYAIESLTRYGIVSGYEDGNFRPDGGLSLEQAQLCLERAADRAGLPVLLQAWNWAVPEGTHHIRLGFDGYRLHDLINDDGYITARLVNPDTGQVKAETEPDLHFDYHEHDRAASLNMEFRALDEDGIPAGEYKLEIDSENWVEDVGLRIEPLCVLAEPFIGDWVNPRELGVGQSAYMIKVEGKNLHKLDDDAVIAFELGAEGGPFFERVLVAAADLKYDRWGYGSLAATFSEELPQEHLWLQLRVGYWDAAEKELEQLPGGDRFALQLADWPVLYDFEADKYYPDDSYHLHFKGWNLPVGKDYTLRLYDYETMLIEIPGSIADAQEISEALVFEDELEPGHYRITLEGPQDHDHFYSRFDWHVEVEETPPDDCFIATAAFGSKLEPAVQTLRLFRDRHLLTNSGGSAFVNFYYHVSPPLAQLIADSSILRLITRLFLLPFAGVAYLILNPVLMLYAVLVILLIAGLKSKYRAGIS